MPFPALTIKGGNRSQEQAQAMINSLIQMGLGSALKQDEMASELEQKKQLMQFGEDLKHSSPDVKEAPVGALISKLNSLGQPFGISGVPADAAAEVSSATNTDKWGKYVDSYSSVLSDLKKSADVALQAGDAKKHKETMKAVNEMQYLVSAVSERAAKASEDRLKTSLQVQESQSRISKNTAEEKLLTTLTPELRKAQINATNAAAEAASAHAKQILAKMPSSEDEKPTEFGKRLNRFFDKEFTATEALDLAGNSLEDNDTDVKKLVALMDAVKAENRKNPNFNAAQYLIQIINKSPARNALFTKLGLTPGK